MAMGNHENFRVFGRKYMLFVPGIYPAITPT
jgi:hypothetical protein